MGALFDSPLMMGEIITALIGLVGIVITAWVTTRKLAMAEHERETVRHEMNLQTSALSFAEFLTHWDEINAEVLRLFEQTCVDRFIIFRAWNGVAEPRWSTAILQMRQAGQTPVAYVHYEMDRDYVQRMKEVTAGASLNFTTVSCPDVDIKKIYQAEGVTAAAWFHIITQDIPCMPTSKAITYCSFGTHSARHVDEPLTESTMVSCRLIVDRLKGIAAGDPTTVF